MPEFLEKSRTLREIAQALREIADREINGDQRSFLHRLADQYDERAKAERAKSAVKPTSSEV
jgi:hypothetical protein